MGRGDAVAAPQTLAFLGIPSVGHFLGLYSPPPLTLSAPRIRPRAVPSPTNFPDGKVKSCHKLDGVELAACESLNSRTEKKVGFDRE